MRAANVRRFREMWAFLDDVILPAVSDVLEALGWRNTGGGFPAVLGILVNVLVI